MYKNISFNQRRLEIILAGFLSFIAFIVLQSLILKKGELGQIILDFLYPFVGLFGICVLIFIMLFLSYMMFFPKNFETLIVLSKQIYFKSLDWIEISWQKIREFNDTFFNQEKKQILKPFPFEEPVAPKNEEIKNLEDEVIFDERNLKISYTNVPNPQDEEEKYARMVRLVDENEEGKVLQTDVERIIQRNKQFFEALSANYENNPKESKENLNIKNNTSTQKNQAKKLLARDLKSDLSHLDPEISKKTQESLLDGSKLFNLNKEEQNFISESLSQNSQESSLQDRLLDKTSSEEVPSTQQESLNQENSNNDFNKINQIKSILNEANTYASQNDTSQTMTFRPTPRDILKHRPLIVKELDENKQLLESLDFGEVEKPKDYQLPSTELLEMPKSQNLQIDENEIDQKIQDLLSKLRMFKIDGDISRTYSGPIVTTFEFRPTPNVKVSRILTLGDDLAMALRAQSIRIQAPIPGKDVVGIEIPNAKTETIYLREILESDVFKNSASPLTLSLGKDIVGNPFVTDLKKLPHLLIAGTTGSGKSVGVNAMILSLLFRNSPDNLKLIMVDPKMVEFSMYADIPHLLTPIITDPKKAISALGSAVKEMERRYKLMSEAKSKNIDKYNPKAKLEGLEVFPFLVIIIDELADLMMTGGKEAEFPIARIAQMGRAAGLHLIVATQRPSVDVVTGLIKTNLPSRVSFKVGSKIDSRVVLDCEGAQSLLGRGDMLFTPPGVGGVVRLHAPWASEEEIEEIVEFIKSQREVEYDKDFLLDESLVPMPLVSSEGGELLDEAKRIILQDKKTSISYLQRKLGIGYNKAASIIEDLQNQGFLSEPNAKGFREIIGR